MSRMRKRAEAAHEGGEAVRVDRCVRDAAERPGGKEVGAGAGDHGFGDDLQRPVSERHDAAAQCPSCGLSRQGTANGGDGRFPSGSNSGGLSVGLSVFALQVC